MTVSEIVKRVRSAIDEVVTNDASFQVDDAFLINSVDEQNLTTIILDKIGYALTWALQNAPQDKLEGTTVATWTAAQTVSVGEFAIGADLVATVKLPSDILRLVNVRLSSWKLSPVPILEQSPEYLMQQDQYARGSWDRPVVVMTHQGSNRVLELYSAKTTSDTLQISFVKKPDLSYEAYLANPNTTVAIPTGLEGAVIYEIAGLAMVSFREEVANSLLTLAKEMLA